MPYRNDIFDYNLNIPSAQRDTAVSYARRLLKCIFSLLVLIAIIVTATAVCCSILVYKQVFGKSLNREDFTAVEATRGSSDVKRFSTVPMTDDVSATVAFTTMSASSVTNIAPPTTGGPTNVVSKSSKLKFCREGSVKRGQRCYYISNYTATWSEAMETCIHDFMGYLAIVNDADENTFLGNFAKPTASEIWLGGSDAFKEGEWRWIKTMRHISSNYFTLWDSLQPDNKDGVQNCLILSVSFGYQWDDMQCHHKSKFVCETNIKYLQIN